MPQESALGLWIDLEALFRSVPDFAFRPAPSTPAPASSAKGSGTRRLAFLHVAKTAPAKERLLSLLKALAAGTTRSPLEIKEALDRAVSESEDTAAIAHEIKAAGTDLAVMIGDGLSPEWIKALSASLRSEGISRCQIDAASTGRKASVIEIVFKLQF